MAFPTLKPLLIWTLMSLAKPPVMLCGHGGAVSSIAWSPGGRLLVSGGIDRTVRVWDPSVETALCALGVGSEVLAITWHGERIAVGTTNRWAILRINSSASGI